MEKAEARYAEAANRTNAFKTIAWYELSDAKAKVQAKKGDAGKWLSSVTKKTHKWTSNPLDWFFMSKEKADARKAKAQAKYDKAKATAAGLYAAAATAEKTAETAGFQNQVLNETARDAIQEWRNAKFLEGKAKKKVSSAKPYNQVFKLIGLGIFFVVFFGMLISNTVGTPKWVFLAIQTEYYIKTGLVLLGAKILFEKIITIGTADIFVAWVVTPVVWLVTYWFGQKVIRMGSKRLNAVICSDMSVCGVSAAIAAASACKAKKEELTLAVGLSLVFTSIMMIVMPAIIHGFFPTAKIEILGGAWMGGTIDATGAVAAAGAFLGEKALNVAATIKMIQNVLIGVMAFFVGLYFATKVEAEETGHKVGLMEIWYRFPKFVIGFIMASVIFSFIYSSYNAEIAGLGSSMIDKGTIKGMSDLFRGWFFILSFVSIGLATNFKELKEHFSGGNPLILYVFGQSFNLCLTLTMAYIMFYLVFPDLTATI